MRLRRTLCNSIPRLLLSSLLFYPTALHAEATFCQVRRTVAPCSSQNCQESARQEFKRYTQSQKNCGVSERNNPFLLQASADAPFKGTVVLVHGLAVNPSHMSHIAKELQSQGYNVVAPILFGHGGSDDYLTHASLSEWEKDMKFAGDIAAKMGGPLYAIGHSTGGVMVGLAASQRPDFYKAIVGLDPALNLEGSHGWQIANACHAKKIWNFPSEVPQLIRNLSQSGSARALTCYPSRDPEFIHLKEKLTAHELIKRYCQEQILPPSFNNEFALASLCALSQATQKMASQQRMQKLPPSLAILSQDRRVFGYIGRQQIETTFSAKPHKIIQSKSPIHGLMVGNCSPGFENDLLEIKNWLARHR